MIVLISMFGWSKTQLTLTPAQILPGDFLYFLYRDMTTSDHPLHKYGSR